MTVVVRRSAASSDSPPGHWTKPSGVQSGRWRRSSKARPAASPTSISRSSGNASTGTPCRLAMAAAVSRARERSLEATRSKGILASVSATISAWRRPSSVSGLSV